MLETLRFQIFILFWIGKDEIWALVCSEIKDVDKNGS